MKIKYILYKLFFAGVVVTALGLQSCEPEYCAACYDYDGIFRSKEIVICADNIEDLNYLMDETEYATGYICEYD